MLYIRVAKRRRTDRSQINAEGLKVNIFRFNIFEKKDLAVLFYDYVSFVFE